MSEKTPSSRRIFIKTKDKVRQIFSFAQNSDGSIYCSSPEFSDAKWLTLQITNSEVRAIETEAIGSGKVSFHGSGMVAVRPNDDARGHRLIVKGHHLLNKEEGLAGVRHLFTIFMKEPGYEPETSHLYNRKSDYCIEANEDLKPAVMIFFAFPQKGIKLSFRFNFHDDDLVNVEKDVLGLHRFGLRYHDVFWFAYRTKHMDKWRKYAHVFYHDGFTFPFFIGTGPGTHRIEYRWPKYSLKDNELTITCDGFAPDDFSNP
jgi:hypothetical protein